MVNSKKPDAHDQIEIMIENQIPSRKSLRPDKNDPIPSWKRKKKSFCDEKKRQKPKPLVPSTCGASNCRDTEDYSISNVKSFESPHIPEKYKSSQLDTATALKIEMSGGGVIIGDVNEKQLQTRSQEFEIRKRILKNKISETSDEMFMEKTNPKSDFHHNEETDNTLGLNTVEHGDNENEEESGHENEEERGYDENEEESGHHENEEKRGYDENEEESGHHENEEEGGHHENEEESGHHDDEEESDHHANNLFDVGMDSTESNASSYNMLQENAISQKRTYPKPLFLTLENQFPRPNWGYKDYTVKPMFSTNVCGYVPSVVESALMDKLDSEAFLHQKSMKLPDPIPTIPTIKATITGYWQHCLHSFRPPKLTSDDVKMLKKGGEEIFKILTQVSIIKLASVVSG